MFIETNPIPVKTALYFMGKVAEEFKLPLCEMSAANKEKLKGFCNLLNSSNKQLTQPEEYAFQCVSSGCFFLFSAGVRRGAALSLCD